MTGSGGLETTTGLAGSTGFVTIGATDFGLDCFTGSGGFETATGLAGSTGFGVHCLTGCVCFGLGGRATATVVTGGAGFATDDGFIASYLAVMELTGGPGLGGLAGEGADEDSGLVT